MEREEKGLSDDDMELLMGLAEEEIDRCGKQDEKQNGKEQIQTTDPTDQKKVEQQEQEKEPTETREENLHSNLKRKRSTSLQNLIIWIFLF